MKLKEIRQLHKGDQVYWKDPDTDPESDCSKLITILTIHFQHPLRKDSVIQIVGMDASYLECFAHELAANKPDEVAFSC